LRCIAGAQHDGNETSGTMREKQNSYAQGEL